MSLQDRPEFHGAALEKIVFEETTNIVFYSPIIQKDREYNGKSLLRFPRVKSSDS